MTQPIALHLSKNETEHTYKQTPEEALLHDFRVLKSNGKTFKDVTDPADGVNKTPRKCADLLSQDYVWELLTRTVPMGIHFFDSKGELKLKQFHNRMMGTSGGVRLSHSLSLTVLST